MSYFSMTENNQIPIKQTESDLSMNNERANTKSKRDFSGSNNPHFGHIQSPQSRAAISSKQKERYSMLRQIVKNSRNAITEERVRQIVSETIADYVKNNKRPISINL
jgi:hypothetical protein